MSKAGSFKKIQFGTGNSMVLTDFATNAKITTLALSLPHPDEACC
jgi:hypothetical protein